MTSPCVYPTMNKESCRHALETILNQELVQETDQEFHNILNTCYIFYSLNHAGALGFASRWLEPIWRHLPWNRGSMLTDLNTCTSPDPDPTTPRYATPFQKPFRSSSTSTLPWMHTKTNSKAPILFQAPLRLSWFPPCTVGTLCFV